MEYILSLSYGKDSLACFGACEIDEIIKMCKEHGITDLYVLNRDFILSAVKEKMEREAQP